MVMWLDPVPLIVPAWIMSVNIYRLCAVINNIAVMVIWHRYLIVNAVLAVHYPRKG